MGNTHLVIRAVDLFNPVLTWLKIYMNRLIFLFFVQIVLLTNILNPFRIFFYDKLRDEYAHHNVDFRVLVMVPNEPGRTWQYDDFRRDYTTLMKGGLKKVSGIDVIINPGIGRVIKKMNPDVMVCAGSYARGVLKENETEVLSASGELAGSGV